MPARRRLASSMAGRSPRWLVLLGRLPCPVVQPVRPAIAGSPPVPLCERHQPRLEHQPVAGDRYRVRVPGLGIAGQPPFAALPSGDFRRVLAEHHPIETFLARFLSIAHDSALRSRLAAGCLPLRRVSRNSARKNAPCDLGQKTSRGADCDAGRGDALLKSTSWRITRPLGAPVLWYRR